MKPRVHIEQQAFLNILSWVAEASKQECLGKISGRKPTPKTKDFYVTNAMLIGKLEKQTVGTVVQSDKSVKRDEELFLDSKQPRKQLGHFHSHTAWGKWSPIAEMSEGDVKNATDLENSLDIIVGISIKKHGVRWRTCRNGNIKGTSGKFHFEFAAFTLVKRGKEKKPQRLRINASEALRKLNRIRKKVAKKRKK